MPKVSIIMANYNGDAYLKESIDSIINQSFQDWELIIIDDYSVDLSIKIIEDYQDKRIKLIKNEINLGPARSRNIGLESCNGKYIAILDSDDIAYKDRLKKQVEFMERNNIDVLGSGAKFFGKYNKRVIPKKNNSDIRTELLLISPYVHSTVIIKKEVLEKFNIKYDEDFRQAQDYKMWSDLSKHNDIKFAGLNKILVKYRVHNNQITSKSLNKQSLNAGKIRKEQLASIGINLNQEEDIIYEKFILSDGAMSEYEIDIIFRIYESIADSITQYNNSNLYNLQCLIDRFKKQLIKQIINGSKVRKLYVDSELRKSGKRNITHNILEFLSVVR